VLQEFLLCVVNDSMDHGIALCIAAAAGNAVGGCESTAAAIAKAAAETAANGICPPALAQEAAAAACEDFSQNLSCGKSDPVTDSSGKTGFKPAQDLWDLFAERLDKSGSTTGGAVKKEHLDKVSSCLRLSVWVVIHWAADELGLAGAGGSGCSGRRHTGQCFWCWQRRAAS
jgi:hypothetical protein